MTRYPSVFSLLAVSAASVAGLFGQSKPLTAGTACVDSKTLPAIAECRLDACERKEADQRTVPVREDDKGEAVTAAIDGQSRSYMYECSDATLFSSIVPRAADGLRAAGFTILYQYVGMEGSLTARKDDYWVMVDAASHFYTLIELKAEPPEFESITDAAGLADAIERYGHVPVYGIKFLAGRADLTPESSTMLREVAGMLQSHPEWRIRVEGHTDNTSPKLTNMSLSARRAAAVVAWLSGAGVKRMRLDSSGLGDTRPVAPNTTQEGRNRNQRIELVKVAAAP